MTTTLPEPTAVFSPQERVQFYFFYMCVSGEVPAVSQPEMVHLLAAYRDLLPYIDRAFPSRASRLKTVFCFGFDDDGVLPCGPTTTAGRLASRVAVLRQVANNASLASQRGTLDALEAFTGEAAAALKTLRHLGYRQGRREDGAYAVTDPTYWGLVLLVLLARTLRADLLADLLDGGYDLPAAREFFEILGETVRAVLPRCDLGETEFRELAARLALRPTP